MRSCECLCSELSLAQQKRTKEGLGPVLAGRRGSAHRRDMKVSGFIRQRRKGAGRVVGGGGNSSASPGQRRGCRAAGYKDAGRMGGCEGFGSREVLGPGQKVEYGWF